MLIFGREEHLDLHKGDEVRYYLHLNSEMSRAHYSV
jgi:hypothetical protein